MKLAFYTFENSSQSIYLSLIIPTNIAYIKVASLILLSNQVKKKTLDFEGETDKTETELKLFEKNQTVTVNFNVLYQEDWLYKIS